MERIFVQELMPCTVLAPKDTLTAQNVFRMCSLSVLKHGMIPAMVMAFTDCALCGMVVWVCKATV